MTNKTTTTTGTAASQTTTRGRAGRKATDDIATMNIHTKLLCIESEIGLIQKTLTVQGEGVPAYSTLSDGEILRVVKPLEHKYRVKSYLHKITGKTRAIPIGGSYYKTIADLYGKYTLVNCDNPEEVVTVDTFAIGEDIGDKAYGKAMTMLRKNALKAIYKIEAADAEDPDSIPSRPLYDPNPQNAYEHYMKADAFPSDEELRAVANEFRQGTVRGNSSPQAPVKEEPYTEEVQFDPVPAEMDGSSYLDDSSQTLFQDQPEQPNPEPAMTSAPQRRRTTVQRSENTVVDHVDPERPKLPQTLEEAESVVLQIRGKNKDKTFGQIWKEDPRNIEFMLKDSFDAQKYPVYKRAAQIIWEAYRQ